MLTSGVTYRMRVAGVNRDGRGEWSIQSFSQPTLPGIPFQPEPPTRAICGLTWIKFKWHAPNDSGSAITGYRVWIKHENR